MKLETKVGEEKAHAKFSASGSERWLNCPGSIALSEKAPPERESEYAAEGTEAHACLEFLLKNRERLAQAKKVAEKKYDADMVEHALFTVRYINGLLAERDGSTLLCETKVDASPFTCDGQFGTLDAAVVEEFGRLTVIDYKYGAGIAVDPEGHNGNGNSQLVYYALGISHQYNHNFSDVELVVVQPRAYHESGDIIRTFVMPMEDLLDWRQYFINGVFAAEQPNPTFAAGKWCRFCRAATICPELKDNALKNAQIVFSDTAGLESVPVPTLIQLPNLGTILAACDRLEDWIGKVRAHAVHVLERGENIPGFKLVEKRAQRKWTDETAVSTEARSKFGDLAFTDPKLVSPAVLEKIAAKSAGVDAWIEERVTRKSSGTTLAPESDKRPAVNAIERAFGVPAAEIVDVPANVFPVVLQGKVPRKKR